MTIVYIFFLLLMTFFPPRPVSLNVYTDVRRWAGSSGGPDNSGENFYLVHLSKEQVFPSNHCAANMSHRIVNLTVRDVRFPTSDEHHGSDAMVSNQPLIYLLVFLIRDGRVALYFEILLIPAAHGPGLFHRLRGVGSGQRAQRLRHHVHPGQRHRHR